jgi:hypothetical protein
MKLLEVKIEQVPSPGGMQLWNPKYREMTLDQIKKQSRIEVEYVPYGYNTFLFCRSTATIHAYLEN